MKIRTCLSSLMADFFTSGQVLNNLIRKIWYGNSISLSIRIPIGRWEKTVHKIELPSSSPPDPGSVGINNWKHIFSGMYDWKKATSPPDIISVGDDAFFKFGNAITRGKSCLQFLIPTAHAPGGEEGDSRYYQMKVIHRTDKLFTYIERII